MKGFKNIKKIAAVIAAVAMMASSTLVAFAETYKDVPSTHWAFNAVERCSKAHWLAGYPDGTFKPNGEILRSEAMKVYVAILGLPLSDVASPTYYDVKATDWYAPYVEAGKYLFPEMAANDGQKKFQPTMPITREVAIYALVKTLGYDSEVKFADESVLNMFSDQKSISTNIRPYMAWAISDGLASGYPDGRIGAQDPLTRAEFATILYRANVTHGFNNTGFVEKVISNISVEPSAMKELKIGESFEISASVAYSDGTAEDYSNNINPYTDGAEGIVTINKNKVTAVGEGTAIIKFNNENMADKSIVVVVGKPTDAPVLDVVNPASSTEAEEAEISGTVTDITGTALTLAVNGSSAAVNADGTFKATVKLALGKNDIIVSAKNVYGNETAKTISIERTAPAATPAPAPAVTPTPAPVATAIPVV